MILGRLLDLSLKDTGSAARLLGLESHLCHNCCALETHEASLLLSSFYVNQDENK